MPPQKTDRRRDIDVMKRMCKIPVYLLTIFVMLSSVNPCAADETEQFSILSYEVTTNSGVHVTSVFEGMDGLKISATIRNDTDSNSDAVLFFAIFDTNDCLKILKVGSVKNDIPSKISKRMTASASQAELQNVKNGDRLAVFLWGNFADMIPLTKPITGHTTTENINDYLYNYSISDFVGANYLAGDASAIGSVRWGRDHIDWGSVMPSSGVFDNNYLIERGEYILEAKRHGVTVLPMLGYTAEWAANRSGYEYVYNNIRYVFGPVVSESGSYLTRQENRIRANGNSQSGYPRNVALSSWNTPFEKIYVEDWKAYIRKVVETYSAEPYNIEYFQVWNEAHPDRSTAFYHGGWEQYMPDVHIAAAEIIQELGCKVVYGGYPGGNNLHPDQLVGALSEYDAWQYTDVFSLHYHDPWDLDKFYYEALKRGYNAPEVWQTEIGWTSHNGFVMENYLSTFYHFLDRRSDNPNQFKQIYFAWYGSQGYDDGHLKALLNPEGITPHGKSMKTLMQALDGDNVSRNTGISTDNNMAFNVGVAQKINPGAGNSLTGFCVDGKRAVAGIVAKGANASQNLSVTQGMKVTFEGIFDPKTVKIMDNFGENQRNLIWNDMGGGKIEVTVPNDYPSSYLYIVVSADAVILPTNNIKNYELGATEEDGLSIIAPGRWSYLNKNHLPLQKGTGEGQFASNDWALDRSYNGDRRWRLSTEGSVHTDDEILAFNYTIDKWQAKQDLNINIKFTPNDMSEKNIRVYKTSDTDLHEVGAERQLLWSYSGIITDWNSPTVEFDIDIPAEELYEGNDIYFEIYSSGDSYWWTPAWLDATVSVAEFKEAENEGYSSNNIIDFSTDANYLDGDRWAYMSHWDFNIDLNEPIWDSNKTPAILPYGLMRRVGSNWQAGLPPDPGSDIRVNPSGYMQGRGPDIYGGRPIIWSYTIGENTAGKDLIIEGVVTGAATTDMHIFKSNDEIVYGTDSKTAIVFLPKDASGRPLINANHENIYFGSYPGIANRNKGAFRVAIPAEEAIAGNDILFWFTFNAWGENYFDVTITAQ